jgi:hypothetical protein
MIAAYDRDNSKHRDSSEIALSLTQRVNSDSLLAMAYRSTERTEARRAAVRGRIVTAALELISEGGYVNAQIAAVAERAGVAVGPSTGTSVEVRPVRRGLPRSLAA